VSYEHLSDDELRQQLNEADNDPARTDEYFELIEAITARAYPPDKRDQRLNQILLLVHLEDYMHEHHLNWPDT
jgi:hypothetical protein